MDKNLRWLQEDEDDNGDPEEMENQKSSGSKAKDKQNKGKEKQKAKKKKKNMASKDAKSGPVNVKGTSKAKTHGAYAAGDYAQRRKLWIQKRKTNHSMSHAQASAAWNVSRTRERLLADMPLAEKVRRRFVAPNSGTLVC